MILVCPSCDKRYRVADGTVGAEGRQVRCRSCGHLWHAMPEGEAPRPEAVVVQLDGGTAQPASPSVEPAAPLAPVTDGSPLAAEDEAPLPPEMRGLAPVGRVERAAGIVAWLVFALLLLGVVGLYVGRERVLALAPWTHGLYASFGLDGGSGEGLEIRRHESSRRVEAGSPVLVVHGEIVNNADEPKAVPAVRVALVDEAGAEVAFGLFEPVERQLAPAAVTVFDAELRDPPAAARTYQVRFADRP